MTDKDFLFTDSQLDKERFFNMKAGITLHILFRKESLHTTISQAYQGKNTYDREMVLVTTAVTNVAS